MTLASQSNETLDIPLQKSKNEIDEKLASNSNRNS